jgi:hypothetical protein
MKIFKIPRRKQFYYKRPSGLERRFIQFIKYNNLPFEFVGTDYSKKIDLSKIPDIIWKTYKLPDFLHHERKIAIELTDKKLKIKLNKLNLKDWQEYEKELSRALKKVGWKVIFVYQDELTKNPDKVLHKIKKLDIISILQYLIF